MISKDNYEIWMMDYLDGNLSDSDQELLLQFLEENPHLKEELNGLDNTILSPINETFNDKTGLLKSQADEYQIEYSEYIAIKEVEEGLDKDELKWKKDYLNENSEHSKLFLLYTKTLLKADQTIRYQFKGSLKRVKLIPALKVSSIKRISAAAAIALLLSVGTLPFLKKSADNIQTVAVNDTPSLITMPKIKKGKVDNSKNNVEEKSIAAKKVHAEKVKTSSKIIQKEKSNNSSNIDRREEINLTPLQNMGIEPIKSHRLNAYEVGLNNMMPIIIANNLEKKEKEYLAMKSHVNEESQRLSRSARAIVSGVKVINFLAGNETTMKKVVNEDGQLVAYQVESDNISIRQRIK